MKFGMRYADVTNSRGRKQIASLYIMVRCARTARDSLRRDARDLALDR